MISPLGLYSNVPAELERFTSVPVVGPPQLVFDWRKLGDRFTALAFVCVNTGAGAVVVTPEISPDQTYVCSAGASVPAALTVPAGEASYDPYGVDLIVPYWRLWVSGTSTCDFYLYGIPRGGR